MENNLKCPDCDADINWTDTHCLRCRRDVGVPNQRELKQKIEVDALEQRYHAAKVNARKLSVNEQQLIDFEQQLEQQSKAVINLSSALLDDFLSKDNVLISNYNLQTQGETRKVADMQNDRERRSTEGILFGSLANNIRYAALSLDEKGLVSYGNCSVSLADITMENSATVLEENSYDFVRRHKILPGDDIPAGFRAIWNQRYCLAIAKLAAKLVNTNKTISDLLLSSDGNRKNDQFMEVHIYGAFDNQAVTSVTVPAPKRLKNIAETTNIMRIRDSAKNKKIKCIEV